ncbi:MAG: hypothetical protein AUJ72_06245 [Candidatus Omnitrophica bacterium CG1_02_46_14]|nr:MAG: hypothetical protein AUJ72_06245 [Candidatus Omnitrophica bacterium CG1_02_46_14]
MRRLGILVTHPIQYYVPLFRYIVDNQVFDLIVYYCQKPSPKEQGAGFGVEFAWDIDLLSGYRHVWLENISEKSGLDHFFGLDTPEIKELIKTQKFDAFMIMGWNYKSMWQAMEACRQTSTPLLVRGDSHLHIKGKWFKRFFKELTHRYLIKKFSACLAVGKWSREYFKHYGARKIFFSPHCVDNDFFYGEAIRWKKKESALKEQWGIPQKSFVFLFAGKFESKKRPMDLLLAVKKIAAKSPFDGQFHVLMVGDGELKKECELFTNAESLPVSFTGFLNQTEMPKAYAVSNALVLSSDFRETWGLVVNEAMSCGLPALVSDQAGCGPDLITEGKNGSIFPCGNFHALSDKMIELIQKEREAGAAQEIRSIIGEYSVKKAVQGIVQVVQEISR